MTLLWVTRAALTDLKLEALAGSDVSRVSNRHPILDAFYSKRAQSQFGTEQLEGVPHSQGIWNLHAINPHRGVTWYDHDEDVVFLLAYSPHDYAVFVSRFRMGQLSPSARDYEDVAQHRRELSGLDDDFLEVVEAQCPDLVARALHEPGQVVEELLGSELPAAALLEVVVVSDTDLTGDLYLALRFADRQKLRALPSEVVSHLIPLLLPDADYVDIDWAPAYVPAELGNRAGDTTIRWRRN